MTAAAKATVALLYKPVRLRLKTTRKHSGGKWKLEHSQLTLTEAYYTQV